MKSKLPVFKKLFIPFHPIVIRQGLRGPSTLRAPYRLLFNLFFTYIFPNLLSEHEEDENSSNRPARKSTVWYRNPSKDYQVKTAYFLKEDMNIKSVLSYLQ
jgi:hypothetical protein